MTDRSLSDRPYRITVLRGGPSAERQISLASGQAVAEALRRRGYQVFESDIGPDDLGALDVPADVIFPALHGPFGEDGQLQRLMEERGKRFVGSGSAASALAMDKVASKRRVASCGIRTPAFQVWRGESEGRLVLEDRGTLPVPPGALPDPPVVVKPPDQGSSVATFIVHELEQLEPTIREVVGRFGRALVERYVAGDELTVGIVGEQTLPPICVRPRRKFYDYEAKYFDDETEYLFDAGHPPELLREVQELSWQVFESLGCRHLARVDWIADPQGRLWFLELNTIPGFTSHSLVPKAAARVGISFDELVERLVLLAWNSA
jgi:D-alanine-D-alanine ligase